MFMDGCLEGLELVSRMELIADPAFTMPFLEASPDDPRGTRLQQDWCDLFKL
jgi:hypothetical protein